MIKITFPFSKMKSRRWSRDIDFFKYDFYLATKCRFVLEVERRDGEEIYFRVSPVIPIEQKPREKGLEYVRGR